MKTNEESNDKINKKLKLNYSSSLIKEQKIIIFIIKIIILKISEMN